MHRPVRRRSLRFESLESRMLLTADLFAGQSAAGEPVNIGDGMGLALESADGSAVIHVELDAEAGAGVDVEINDLAFAALGRDGATEISSIG